MEKTTRVLDASKSEASGPLPRLMARRSALRRYDLGREDECLHLGREIGAQPGDHLRADLLDLLASFRGRCQREQLVECPLGSRDEHIGEHHRDLDRVFESDRLAEDRLLLQVRLTHGA
jgi:hypothetical protein